MIKLLAYFPSGLEKEIENVIVDKVPNAQVDSVSKGEAIVEVLGKLDIDQICNIPIFHNVLLIIDQPTKEFSFEVSSYIKSKKIRVMSYDERQTVKLDKSLLEETESRLEEAGGIVDRANPEIELWIVRRTGGFNGWALRLTSHPDFHEMEKSELRPEIAYFMNYLSEPSKDDVWLDPFCGSGSLAISRAKHFPYKKIISSDIDIQKAENNIDSELNGLENIVLEEMNYKDMQQLQKMGINKIVTDPEWGVFNKAVSLEKMYELFFYKAKRLLKGDGVLILLTHKSNDELVMSIVNRKVSSFNLIAKYQVYVWNQPAYIYKLRN